MGKRVPSDEREVRHLDPHIRSPPRHRIEKRLEVSALAEALAPKEEPHTRLRGWTMRVWRMCVNARGVCEFVFMHPCAVLLSTLCTLCRVFFLTWHCELSLAAGCQTPTPARIDIAKLSPRRPTQPRRRRRLMLRSPPVVPSTLPADRPPPRAASVSRLVRFPDQLAD